MRRVWRVENVNSGHGPYTCPEWEGSPFDGFQQVLEDQDIFHDMTDRHPVQGWSSQEQFGESCRFGFDSVTQLRRWFDYFGEYGYDLLRENGFHLASYDVEPDAVHEWEHQITFDISQATLSHTEEL